MFSPDGSRLIRAIGVKGGRPWIGAWNPNGMLLPRGIAVTNNGKLWVAEDDASPNRISVWDAATGAFIRDYIGPSPYGGGANFWVDPSDTSTVLAEGTLFHVDYAKKTWTPVSTPFRRMSMTEPFTPNGMFGGQPGCRTIVHDGKQFVYWTYGTYGMVVMRRDGDRLTPVAAAGCLGRWTANEATSLHVWDSDIGTHNIKNYYPSFFAGHSGDDFIWVNKNGDGEVQADEVQWIHTIFRFDKWAPGLEPEWTSGWGFGFGPDGALYMPGFCVDRNILTRVELQSWLPNGNPNYDASSAKEIILEPSELGIQGVFVTDNNRILLTRPYEGPKPVRTEDCYDHDGNHLWTIAAPQGAQQADDILADNVIADIHEPGNEHLLATWLWHANFKPYVFTEDGLYVSSLLDDTRLGPTATWDESYKDYFQAPDGSAYIMDGVNDAYHIDKIIGLDQIHRFSGAAHGNVCRSKDIASCDDRKRQRAATIAPTDHPYEVARQGTRN